MDAHDRRRLADELVRQHYPMLLRLAFRLTGNSPDAADLTQHTLLIACSRLEQLRQTDSAGGWLCAILRTRFLQGKRRDSRRQNHDEAWFEATAATEPEETVDRESLQTLLNEMPETYRIPVVLFYYCDMDTQQIAHELEIPEGTVSSRLSRGRAFLRRRWRPHD